MSNSNTNTTNWPDLAIGLYDRLTDRKAEITYEFSEMQVAVPSGTGASPQQASWKLDGSLTIRTRDLEKDPN